MTEGVTCPIAHRHQEWRERRGGRLRSPASRGAPLWCDGPGRRGRSDPAASLRGAQQHNASQVVCNVVLAMLASETACPSAGAEAAAFRGCRSGGPCTTGPTMCGAPPRGCAAQPPWAAVASPGCTQPPGVPRAPACAISQGGVGAAGPYLCASAVCARGLWLQSEWRTVPVAIVVSPVAAPGPTRSPQHCSPSPHVPLCPGVLYVGVGSARR